MKRRRLIFGGFASLAWLGCAAVAGLDSFEIVAGSSDANADGMADASSGIDSAAETDSTTDGGPLGADVTTGPPVIDAGPCGACGPGAARTMCLDDACTATYRVFVTNDGFDAVLGGTNGADLRCQSAAEAAGLGGTWKAWISADDASTPNQRFTRTPALPFRLVDGTLIASLNTDLLTTSRKPLALLHPIDLDEHGASPDGGQLEVWTGTDTTGAAAGTCEGWTTDDGGSTGAVGLDDSADANWSEVYPQFCDRAAQHLYCFEQ